MRAKPIQTKNLNLVSTQTAKVTKPPPEWEMDSYGHFFASSFGLNSKIGKEIGALMHECEDKIMRARLDMYSKIQVIVKEANMKHKEPHKPSKPSKSSLSHK